MFVAQISEKILINADDTEGQGTKTTRHTKNLRQGLTVRETEKRNKEIKQKDPYSFCLACESPRPGWPAIPSDPFPVVSPSPFVKWAFNNSSSAFSKPSPLILPWRKKYHYLTHYVFYLLCLMSISLLLKCKLLPLLYTQSLKMCLA